eukprot:4567135-Alexandrium_andersonii.AAC.1
MSELALAEDGTVALEGAPSIKLSVAMAYQHMGSIVHAFASMRDEARRRSTLAFDAFRKMGPK